MTLEIFWFFIVGVLFVGYFVLDGFDFGVGMSLPFLGKNDTERRQIINTIGPVWDLNETWVIVAGACLFAAFPEWYSTLFSGAYLALVLILIALIFRGVSFEYRHQGHHENWSKWFDWFIVIGSAVPALLWGVAVANIVNGLPILKVEHSFIYQGTLLTLLNPYALLGGLTTLLLFFTHGVQFVGLKTDGKVKARAHRLGRSLGLITIVVAALFLLWTNIAHFSPLVLVLSLLAAVTLIISYWCNWIERDGLGFTFTALTVVFAVLALWMVLFTSYPEHMVMPSTYGLENSLTLTNASSSTNTLSFMTWVAAFALPVVLLYQGWTYWVFRKRVRRVDIEQAAVAH
ncbi:cytochrome d ubiquinol oxidase subunit II [Pseudoclavibacter sp. CFCC 14310]|uniref:cytochrome d ubiquinol oxidase subunit II n=1 Tax=Pseudoclavibacter sp. CFCC 14310 TaxID=2615180 RepID=UPI001301644B|nr:cytochrome d ubiquinol oxidase subunit II [Pseudoclavibacter sp. CFCC 14310]KAB1645511.1 cytochrome d ubiquinol oxidase subunit II [Pseudoclavibacter sp. CFCC 14310]KAB1646030.1 cytochrome d ubiquinol oxidase subunit II [Pseudoclavibacter sp. CFCC 14310]